MRSYFSDPGLFYLTPTQIFSGASASLSLPWKAVDFYDKVIFAQRSVATQAWKQSTGIYPLPGLPANDTYDGVESFQGHLLLWKNEILKWSDLNDVTNHIPVAETVAYRDPRQARDPVAAHLGHRAIGVAELHRAVGAVAAREKRDQPVGAHAEMAVAQARRDVGARRAPVGSRGHEEVVAGAVQLGEPDPGGAHEVQVARSAGSTSQGLSGAPSHMIRGSRRNHIR